MVLTICVGTLYNEIAHHRHAHDWTEPPPPPSLLKLSSRTTLCCAVAYKTIELMNHEIKQTSKTVSYSN